MITQGFVKITSIMREGKLAWQGVWFGLEKTTYTTICCGKERNGNVPFRGFGPVKGKYRKKTKQNQRKTHCFSGSTNK
jgi:hypothetical protein